MEGFIVQQPLKSNNQAVHFSLTDNPSDFKKYSSQELMSFRIENGLKFISKEIQFMSWERADRPQGTEINDTNYDTIEEQVFVAVLVEGDVELFLFIDKKGEERFLTQKAAGKLEELVMMRIPMYKGRLFTHSNGIKAYSNRRCTIAMK